MSDGFDAARHTVLLGAVCRLPGPIFAVVDGSWFADLPRLLAGRGLAHRSLFWDGGEPELLSAGPWLVDLGGERLEAQERLLDIAENKPAVVFWSCPGGAAILHKHLRSINEVLVPNRPETSASHSALHRSDHGEDRVLFRHWDPRVLASVAPLLDEEQAARLFGPADGIALDSGYGRGPGSIMRPPALPIAPTGILRFSHEQLDALDDEQLSRFRWETVSYLRKHCHEQTATFGDTDLYKLVCSAEVDARQLSLEDEADRMRWAWLWVAMKGHLSGIPEVRAFMTDPENGATPTERLDLMWEEILQEFDEIVSPSGRA